jgi:PAS domain S-box-containing protein
MNTCNKILDAIDKYSLYTAFDFSTDPIAITDANIKGGVRFIYINDAFCKETGYKKEELIGQNPRILQGEQSNRELLTQLKKEIAQGHNFVGQTVNYKKDGTPYYVKWSISPLKNSDNEIIAFMSIHKIISLQVKAQKENLLLQEIIQQAPGMMLVTDLNANIIYVNDAFIQNSGYSKDELVGNNARILKSGKQSEQFYRKMWEKLTNTQRFEGVFISKRKDGSLFFDNKKITLIKDKEGIGRYYLAVSHDITSLANVLKQKYKNNQTPKVPLKKPNS